MRLGSEGKIRGTGGRAPTGLPTGFGARAPRTTADRAGHVTGYGTGINNRYLIEPRI